MDWTTALTAGIGIGLYAGSVLSTVVLMGIERRRRRQARAVMPNSTRVTSQGLCQAVWDAELPLVRAARRADASGDTAAAMALAGVVLRLEAWKKSHGILHVASYQ